MSKWSWVMLNTLVLPVGIDADRIASMYGAYAALRRWVYHLGFFCIFIRIRNSRSHNQCAVFQNNKWKAEMVFHKRRKRGVVYIT